MKFSLNKKEEVATIENIKEKNISPYQGWLIVLSICTAIIILSALYSAFIFYRLLEEDDFQPDATSQVSKDQFIDIDVGKLNSAAEFISSRGGKVKGLATSTATTTP